MLSGGHYTPEEECRTLELNKHGVQHWFCQLDEASELWFPYLQDEDDNTSLCRPVATIKSIYPFNKYLLNIYCVLATAPGADYTAVNKTKSVCLIRQ